MKLRAIFFDFDDTIVDLKEASLIAFNSALKRHNLRQISFDEMIQIWHLTWKEVVKQLAPDEANLESLMKSLAQDYMSTFSEIHLDYSKIYPEAYKTLKELHKRGILIAIVSRRFRKIIEEEVEKFKLRSFIDVIIGYQNVSEQKPAPDSIVLATKKLGVPIRNCAVVGDSPVDIKAGRLAGAFTISVLTGPSKAEDLRTEHPNVVINTIADLIPTLKELGLIT